MQCDFCHCGQSSLVCAPERITFQLAVIVYRTLRGTAPCYLSDQLHRVADMLSRSRLRSASSNWFDIRPSWLVTVGDRSFASASPRVWNSLPEDVTSAPSLPVFWRKLKTHLFRHSYPDIGHRGATLWGSSYYHCSRESQPTERFYKSVRRCSRVHRYKTLWPLPVLTAVDNSPQELALSVIRGSTGSREWDRSSYVVSTGDSIIITQTLLLHHTGSLKFFYCRRL